MCGNNGLRTRDKIAMKFISYIYNRHIATITQGYMQNDKQRIEAIWKILKTQYPNAHIMLSYSTPWELLVAVILSAQCTDKMVNIVTTTLFAKYKTLADYAKADIKEFEQDIRSTGFYHNKTKHIVEAAQRIQENFNGAVPHTMDEILTLPGVARKTANVVLSNAYNVIAGIAVDTHVMRLSERLQLASRQAYGNPVKIEQELMRVVPTSEWGNVTYRLIDHGRTICQAKRPKCQPCPLQKICPSAHLV
jgi:endonuclease-3